MTSLMAWRNIWRNRTRSIIIILSVAVGMLSAISVMALYKGMLRSRVRTLIESETGHIQLHARDFKKDYDPGMVLSEGNTLLQTLRSMPGVKLAAPRSVTYGMLSTTTGSSGVLINGVDPDAEYSVSQLKNKITEGSAFDPAKKNQIMIGKKLADKMKLKPGGKLVLTFTDVNDNLVAGAFRVAAVYRSDNAPLDEKNVYLLLNDLNSLLGNGTSFHEIVLLLHHNEDVSGVHAALLQSYPQYAIETWKDISPETLLMANTIDDYSYIILIIIMLALSFGIINTMLMAVLERTREIGMMVALGVNRRRLFLLILLETIFLTLAGVPAGLLCGWALTRYFNQNGLDLSVFGEEMMSSFGYSTMVYPEFPWERLTGILVIVTVTALASCLLPALRALRLQPAEALRR